LSKACRLAVRLTPRAAADAITGFGLDQAGREVLEVRVRARPVEGQANLALERLIADALGLPKSAVAVARGGSGRLKQLSIEGLDAAAVRARLAARLEARS
jgi:uncharacterized protein YggU (UPF0235/DUF167 family)